MKATVFIVGVLALVLGAGGYYFFSYQPAQYAKQVLAFYDESGPSYQALFGGGTINDPTDYVAAEQVLAIRTSTLGQLKEKINTLEPPHFGDLKDIQPDLEGSIADFAPIIADAKDTLTFLEKLTKLKKLFRPDSGAMADQRTATVGDMARYMDTTVPDIEALGAELFSGNIPKLGNAATFEKLKDSWEAVVPAFAVSSAMAHRMDPTTHLTNFPTAHFSESELSATSKMEQFQRLLDQMLQENSVNSILSYEFLTHSPGTIPASLAARGERVGQAISKLKKQYGK